MARKKTVSTPLFDEERQLEHCIKVLRNAGYGVLKIDSEINIGEAERVEELKALGYKVEHYKDLLIKVDPCQITSVDDIVVYFYEKLRRAPFPFVHPEKLKDKKYRTIDRSVINTLILWRISEGRLSFKSALEEMFILIDTLFEKAEEWKLKIDRISILSINHNKSLVLDLLREVHVKQDKNLCFKVDQLIQKEDLSMYPKFLYETRKRIGNQTSEDIPIKRKIVKT